MLGVEVRYPLGIPPGVSQLRIVADRPVLLVASKQPVVRGGSMRTVFLLHLWHFAHRALASSTDIPKVARSIRHLLRDRFRRQATDSPPILALLFEPLRQQPGVHGKGIQGRQCRRDLARLRRGQVHVEAHLGRLRSEGPVIVEAEVGGSPSHGAGGSTLVRCTCAYCRERRALSTLTPSLSRDVAGRLVGMAE